MKTFIAIMLTAFALWGAADVGRRAGLAIDGWRKRREARRKGPKQASRRVVYEDRTRQASRRTNVVVQGPWRN